MTEEVGIVGSIIGALALILGVYNKVTSHSFNEFLKEHKTLWDSHNKKENDSKDFKELKERFETHKENYVRFETVTNANYQHILETVKQNSQAIVHVENNMKQGFNNISKALERINHKLDIE